MRTTIALRDVVGETLHDFGITIVPLHGDIDGDVVFFATGLETLGVQHRLGLVHVLDKTAHTTGIGEVLAFACALIDQLNLHPIIQEGKFAQALCQNLIMEFNVAEDLFIRKEVDFCAAFIAFTHLPHR